MGKFLNFSLVSVIFLCKIVLCLDVDLSPNESILFEIENNVSTLNPLCSIDLTSCKIMTFTQQGIIGIFDKLNAILYDLQSTSPINEQQWLITLSQILDIQNDIRNNIADLTWTNTFDIANLIVQLLDIIVESTHILEAMSKPLLASSFSQITIIGRQLSSLVNFKMKPEINLEIVSLPYSGIEFYAHKFTGYIDEILFFDFQDMQLRLPFSAIFDPPDSNTAQFVIVASAIYFKHLSKYLTISDTLQINSQSISFTVADGVNLNGQSVFQYTSKNVQSYDSLIGIPVCVYWNPTEHDWSPLGCSYNASLTNRTHTVCECAHLSSFAVLHDLGSDTNWYLLNVLLQEIISTIDMNNKEWYFYWERLETIISQFTNTSIESSPTLEKSSLWANLSLTIANNLIERPTLWQQMEPSERFDSASRIFKILQTLALFINVNIAQGNAMIELKHSSVILQSKPMKVNRTEDIEFSLSNNALRLPLEALKYKDGDLIGVTAMAVNSFNRFIPYGNMPVNSWMMSLVVEDSHEIDLDDPYKFRFSTQNIANSAYGDAAHCAFWSSLFKNWSTAGCSAVSFDVHQTTCECIYVYNFQVALLDPSARSDIINALHTLLDSIVANGASLGEEEWFNYIEDIEWLVNNITSDSASAIRDQLNWNTTVAIIDLSLKVLDTLVGKHNIWKQLKREQRIDSFNKFSAMLQKLSALINFKMSKEVITFQSFRYKSISMQSYLFTVNLTDQIKLIFEDILLELPFKALNYPENSPLGATLVMLKNLDHFLGFDEYQFVNSEPFQLIIGDGADIELSEPYLLRYVSPNKYISNVGSKPKCAFWNHAANQTWLSNGCYTKVLESGASKTVCECRHVTGMNTVLLDTRLSGQHNPFYDYANRLKVIFAGLNTTSALTKEQWIGNFSDMENVITQMKMELMESADLNEVIALLDRTLPILNYMTQQSRIWKMFDDLEKKKYATKLFQMVQSFSLLLNAKQHIDSGYLKAFKSEAIEMQSSMFTIAIDEYIQFWLGAAHIELKTSELRGRDDNGQHMVSATSAIFHPLPEYLKFGNLTINSPIVTLVVDDQVEVELSAKWFEFNSTTLDVIQSGDYQSCGYWNLSEANWLSEHNDYESINDAQFTCRYNRTGYVAALNDITLRGHSIDQAVAGIESVLETLNETNGVEVAPETWSNLVTSLSGYVFDARLNRDVERNMSVMVTDISLAALDKLLSNCNLLESLPDREKLQSVQNILRMVEDISVLIQKPPDSSDNTTQFSRNETTLDNIVFSYRMFNSSENITFNFSDSITLHLPSEALNTDKYNEDVQFAATAVVLKNINGSSYMLPTNLSVNSPVISLNINGHQSVNLNPSHKFKFGMPNVESLQAGDKAQCAYWDFARSTWLTDGCEYNRDESDEAHTICECDHLTDFAMLTDISLRGVIEDVVNGMNDLEQTTQQDNISDQQWIDSLQNATNWISNITQDHILDVVNETIARDVTHTSLKVINNLIEQPVWKNQTDETAIQQTSSDIFALVQDLSILMNAKPSQSEKPINTGDGNVKMQTKTFVNDASDRNKHMEFDLEYAKFKLPMNNFNASKFAASIAVLNNVSEQLSRLSGSNSTVFMNSPVVSITVAGERDITLNASASFYLRIKNKERLYFRDKPSCVYWNFTSSNWSHVSCNYSAVESNREYTTCKCSHLSDFAALVDILHREKPSLAKDIMTYVCSGLTCAFIVAALYISLKYNKENYTVANDQFMMKSNKFAITLNIYGWLFVSHILIMFGMDLNKYDSYLLKYPFCDANSILLLFSLLTTFSFMFMLAIHLYLHTSQEYMLRFVSFKKFAAFGYIFPIAVIAVSVLALFFFEFHQDVQETIKSLAGDYFCWISHEKYPIHIWIFVGPMSLLVLINFCLLASVLYTLKFRKKNPHQVEIEGSSRLGVSLIMSYILMFNLGIPWLIYIFYISAKLQVYASYLFIAVNGTQGFVLFLEQYYIKRNKEKKLKEKLIKRQISGSTKSTYVSVAE